MELAFAAATDVGRQRNHNEDNVLIDKRLQLFIVADGMGGHAAGEVASSIAVHELRDAVFSNRDLLERFARGDAEVQGVEILQMLEHAVQSACGAVFERAQAEPEKRGMGTTATVLLIVDGLTNPRGFIAHVGDSRIYLTRQRQTHQLTEDHSLMNELVKRGKIQPGEIDNSPYKQFKNAVTRAVGVYASVEVDTFDFDILPGDQFLMCSDGMYMYLREEELPALLADPDVTAIPKKLVAKANQGGGHDNITTVIVRIPDEATEADPRAQDVALKLEVLKGMPLFRYLSYKELVRVVNITETMDFPAGVEIIHEGEPGESMYVLLDGSVRLHKGASTIAELGKGQHFGEMALVDRSRRSLSATATAPARLLSIRRKDFYEIIKKEPSLSVKLLWSFVQVLAERLRKTTAELEEIRGEHEIEPEPPPRPPRRGEGRSPRETIEDRNLDDTVADGRTTESTEDLDEATETGTGPVPIPTVGPRGAAAPATRPSSPGLQRPAAAPAEQEPAASPDSAGSAGPDDRKLPPERHTAELFDD
jgi:serine/threonine protein phosphatase PrpC/CRP-like cAMP-binding protein